MANGKMIKETAVESGYALMELIMKVIGSMTSLLSTADVF